MAGGESAWVPDLRLLAWGALAYSKGSKVGAWHGSLALTGFVCPNFGLYVQTMIVLGAFGYPEDPNMENTCFGA